MKTILLIVIVILNALTAKAQLIGFAIDVDSPSPNFKTGDDLLNYLNKKHASGPCKAYTFSQNNTHYQHDSIIGVSVWHEAIEFPDKFRIDFGDTTNGNFVVFKNDSAFTYKHNVLVKVKYDSNTLLLLLGGMYYRPFDETINRLQKANYKTTVLSEQKWNKQKVYVIGAHIGDTTSNQIWIDKKTERVVRIIEKMENNHIMDMTFEEYQKHCNGYVETQVTFKDNGKIEQKETYYNIKVVDGFSEKTFNPKK